MTRIFGGAAGNEGLGLFSLCFDWQYVGSGGSAYGALFQPIQTQLSSYVGLALCMWVTFAIIRRGGLTRIAASSSAHATPTTSGMRNASRSSVR